MLKSIQLYRIKKNDKTKLFEYVDVKVKDLDDYINELSLNQGRMEKDILRW